MLPAMDGPAAPPPAAARGFRAGGARGWAWIEVDAALERDVERWIAERDVPGAEVLKAGSVFRRGELVIKFLPTPIGPIQRRRVPPAVRAARQHFALQPLHTPRPLIALKADTPSGRVDLLVSEFVHGRPFDVVWAADPRAREALPAVLAALRRRRIVHGDLHPGNLLWTGSHWVLLDLEAVRGGLHRIFAPRRAALSQWARLLILTGDEPGLREAHARWLEQLGVGGEPRRWKRVLAAAQRQRATRALGPSRARAASQRTARRSGPGKDLA
jgi:Phosphotransferase enzyme family